MTETGKTEEKRWEKSREIIAAIDMRTIDTDGFLMKEHNGCVSVGPLKSEAQILIEVRFTRPMTMK